MIIGIDASRAATIRRTGTEVYAYNLVQALIPQAAAVEISLRLYFNQKPADILFPYAAHVEHVVLPFPRLWTHLRLGWELRSRTPDVFFTPAHVIPAGYRGVAAATVHDLGFLHFPKAHTFAQVVYLRWSTRHNARRSKILIADSEATKRDLVDKWQLDPKKIRVIYPGIDPMLKPVSDKNRLAAIPKKYGITPPYLLHLGTLQPRKNLVRLIDAYATSGLMQQLVLAGGIGWREESIAAALARQNAEVRRRIILPGYIEETDKGALISAADALVYPSLYEGFGFPLIEANVCKTPVLASNASSLPEIAGDGGALLVDPLDVTALREGMQQIVNDASLREQLIASGYANYQRFSWDEAARQVLEVLVESAATSAE
jgi:glycosyltransferase involved in cell wall biosynthesis